MCEPLPDSVLGELDRLWEPVYPHLAADVLSRSGLERGRLLEIGPFAGGVALAVLWQSESFLAAVVDRSEAVLRRVEERAAVGGFVSRLTTRRGGWRPLPEADGTFDAVVARGAFFYLSEELLSEVMRVLRPGGFGFVGGGWGARTPPGLIAALAARSRVLNEALGKRHVGPEELRATAERAGCGGAARISEEGGLWLELRP